MLRAEEAMMLAANGQLSDFRFEYVAALVNTGTLKAGL
jgi:hypothetical protein